jgi:hypothetical protein
MQVLLGKIRKPAFTTAQTGSTTNHFLILYTKYINFSAFTAVQCTSCLVLWALVQMVVIEC